MEFHKLSNVFPLMEDDQLAELAEDIRRNGRKYIGIDQNKKFVDLSTKRLATIR